eukprot:scaffold41344_cov36-Phaeocystis_antarctica.AAC.1
MPAARGAAAGPAWGVRPKCGFDGYGDTGARVCACVRRLRAAEVGRRGARLCLERLHHLPEDDGDQHDGAARTLELCLSDWVGLRQLQVIQRAEQERLKVAGCSIVA